MRRTSPSWAPPSIEAGPPPNTQAQQRPGATSNYGATFEGRGLLQRLVRPELHQVGRCHGAESMRCGTVGRLARLENCHASRARAVRRFPAVSTVPVGTPPVARPVLVSPAANA